VLERSVELARSVAAGVVAVVPPSRAATPGAGGGADVVVAGGSTRSESVRAGLGSIPADAEVVVVHDAARPLASVALFAAVLDAVVAGADGAIPGLPLTDTVKQVDSDVVVATLDRSTLVTVQTPQAFRATALRAAHGNGADATDDAALLERAGCRVVVVDGEATNLKITDPSDLEAAEQFLAARAVAPG
jgi:2-C-methyl-D-erythritol 4-phosphate cytidylyltransferase